MTADIVITAYYCFELAVNLLAFGLVSGPNSLLRSGWAKLDTLVVAVSIAGELLRQSNSSSIRSLRALRALRSLRVLRAISRLPALRLIIDALTTSVARVKETVLVIAFVMYIFAVIGLQNFAGGTGTCSDAGPGKAIWIEPDT